jgi:hypothetical protein
MILPLTLILLATTAAWTVAFGTSADLARHAHGLKLIMLARQLQWPMVGLSLLLSIALLGLVIAGRRRAWWLIGLGPILALFAHRFAPSASAAGVLENPQFVEASSPAAPRGDEWVVGVVFEKEAYAFPYRALYVRPMVVVTDYDKRMLLLWSAGANRATAWSIANDFRPRELEILCAPMDSLLVLNRRYGQFICAVTGTTTDAHKPIGFLAPVACEKTTFAAWHVRHPQTRAMAIPVAGANAPAAPIVPRYFGRGGTDPQPTQRIAMLATTQPIAISADVKPDEPINVTAGATRLLVVRDPLRGRLRAFDRRVADDLFPTFRPHHDTRRPEVALVDSDTGSLWTIDGRAVDGELKGRQLREVEVDDGLWWGVMRYWYPGLELVR